MLAIAQKLVGAKNVWRAIDLIEFDNRLEPAMNHVFGSALVCSDLDTANKVAFHPEITGDDRLHRIFVESVRSAGFRLASLQTA